MDKIQAAIAKARATRAESGADAPHGAQETLRDHKRPAAAPSDPVVDKAPHPDNRAWALMTPYTPDLAHLERIRVQTLTASGTSALFDQMRTKILQTMRANRWKRLAITSPSPRCGKSTLSLNLGFSMARQPELRSLLVELDLRRPSLARMLGAQPVRSVTDVLRGKLPLEEQALCYNGNLAFAPCTETVPNSAELLQSSTCTAQISAAETVLEPDLILFDMPPMLVSDDVMSFASQVDCVLLVAAAEATTIKEIDACERELASQTNVMGVVLNKCLHTGAEPGYGYGYGKY